MRFVAEREFNGATWYGYRFGTDAQVYWSMRLYLDTGYVANARWYGM